MPGAVAAGSHCIGSGGPERPLRWGVPFLEDGSNSVGDGRMGDGDPEITIGALEEDWMGGGITL